MKILVTGGTGFTGSRLVEFLLEKGHDITCLDNQEGLFFEELAQKGARMIPGSVTDRETVKKAIEGAEAVFHLAAAFRVINVPKKVYWDTNVEGTRIICDEALRQKVKKLVYCSTQGVHGNIQDPPGDEDSPVVPADYYQFTKYEGEKVVTGFVDKGLKSVIIRPTAIYGPGDPERFLFLFRLAKKKRFIMFGNGRAYYHPVYIDNLVDGFYAALMSSREKAEPYIIADEEYFTIKQLVKKVGQSMGIKVRFLHLPFMPLYILAAVVEAVCVPLRIKPPIFRRRVDWFRQNRAFVIDRPKKEIGYIPRVGIDEGLRKTAEWYKQEGYI
jgi:nucleoside-diphosphate-sugar epimerase